LYCMCVYFGVFWSLSCIFCSMGSLFSVLFISLSGHYCDFNEKNVKLVLPFLNLGESRYVNSLEIIVS
jgi:hypothetical protein